MELPITFLSDYEFIVKINSHIQNALAQNQSVLQCRNNFNHLKQIIQPLMFIHLSIHLFYIQKT